MRVGDRRSGLGVAQDRDKIAQDRDIDSLAKGRRPGPAGSYKTATEAGGTLLGLRSSRSPDRGCWWACRPEGVRRGEAARWFARSLT